MHLSSYTCRGDCRWLPTFERAGKRFERTLEAGEVLAESYAGRAAAFGDLDDDGDVDVVMLTLNDLVRVFRNDAPLRDVVVVQLTGRGGNRNGLGSMVELIEGDQVQRRWIRGGSYQSVDAPLAYFGLFGKRGNPVRLRVRWANGEAVDYGEIPVNRRTRVVEGRPAVRSVPLRGRGE